MPRLKHHAKQALIQERQQQILRAAAQIFAEKGFDAATIRDIARAAGVAEGSIYLYFKNKQDLLVHLPRQFIQPPVDASRAASSDAAPETLLNFIAQNIVNVITHNRELIRVLFTSLPTMDDATRATYLREGPGYAIEMIETYLRAQQTAGIFRADIDPEIAARIFPGMMMFFLLAQEILQSTELPRFEYAQVIPNITEIFLHGLMNPSRPKKKLRVKRQHARKKPAHKASTRKIEIE